MQGRINGARLEQIEAFTAVAEHGGFAAAARTVGRDASVISRRIDALEARLGVRLLARTTRRVAVTEPGKAYLRRVQVILAELAAADAEVAEGAVEPRGLLRLSVPAAFGRRWVAPSLPGFVASHPLLRVEVQHADRYVDLVAEGFDAAIRVGALRDSGLVVRRLAPFRRLLCASPAYLAARGTPASPLDLERHACLGLAHHRLWPDWRLRRGAERVTVRAAGPLVSDDSETLAIACAEGAGVMLASDWLIGRELADGHLVEVLSGWSLDDAGAIHVVLPPGRLVPAKTRAFVDWLVEYFMPTAPWRRRS